MFLDLMPYKRPKLLKRMWKNYQGHPGSIILSINISTSRIQRQIMFLVLMPSKSPWKLKRVNKFLGSFGKHSFESYQHSQRSFTFFWVFLDFWTVSTLKAQCYFRSVDQSKNYASNEYRNMTYQIKGLFVHTLLVFRRCWYRSLWQTHK